MIRRPRPIVIRLGRREAVGLGVVAVLLAAASPIFTEQMTMTTYYPSPYGVYDRARVLNDAYIAYSAANPNARLGVGTQAPQGKLDVSGTGNVLFQTTGRVGINSANPPDTYATRLDVAGGNIHVQGNENATRLRVGDAWGYNGVYSEGGDLVLGAQSGWVRVGPNFGGQRLRAENPMLVRTVEISNPSCGSVAFANGVTSCSAGQYATFIEGINSPLMRQSVPLIGGASRIQVQSEIGMVWYDASAGFMLCCNP